MVAIRQTEAIEGRACTLGHVLSNFKVVEAIFQGNPNAIHHQPHRQAQRIEDQGQSNPLIR